MAPMGCGLLVGPPAVPKRPQCGAAWHLPGVLTAYSEPTLKVLCSVLVPFLQAQKRPISHAQVLLYWFCPSDAAVPVELGLSSSPAKGLVHLKSCPEVPSSSFPPETCLLLTTWFQTAAVETMQLSHAWQSKEGHPEPRKERHTSAQTWDGGGESGS